MSVKIIVSLCCVVLLAAYAAWTFAGRQAIPVDIQTGKLILTVHGEAHQRGNLIAIQPYMLAEDYQSQASFYAKLDHYFNVADSQGWFSDSSIVVLPEYLGTWLVTAGEKQQVYRNPTIQGALTTLVASNPFAFIRAYFKARAPDKVKDAVFRMKAREMAAIYTTTCTELARKWRVYIVAGSIILPDPYIENNQLRTGDGSLYNIALLFHPDGSMDKQITVKAYPTADEHQFIVAGNPDSLPVYETSAGKLGIAICADSWYPDIYDHFADLGAELLAVPSFLIPDNIMDQPWQGYSGSTAPADVMSEDVHTLSEAQAWKKYALLGRYHDHGFVAGVNVFLRGQLWDLGSDGRTYAFRGADSYTGQRINASVMNCLWF